MLQQPEGEEGRLALAQEVGIGTASPVDLTGRPSEIFLWDYTLGLHPKENSSPEQIGFWTSCLFVLSYCFSHTLTDNQTFPVG